MTFNAIGMDDSLSLQMWYLHMLRVEPQAGEACRPSANDVTNDLEFALGTQNGRVHFCSHSEETLASFETRLFGPVMRLPCSADDGSTFHWSRYDERPGAVSVHLRDGAVTRVGDQAGLTCEGTILLSDSYGIAVGNQATDSI